MTSRYILDAVERAKLPIRVTFTPGMSDPDGLAHVQEWDFYENGVFVDGAYTSGDATRAYFDLVSKLQSLDPATPPLAGTAAACSSSSPPWVG